MSSSGGSGRRRDEDGSVLQGSWLWVALPVGILALIAALWFLVVAPAGSTPPRATATPTRGPTVRPTLTTMVLAVPTRTAELATVAPTATKPAGIAVGVRAQVGDTGASRLRVRQNPGTNTVTLKLLPDGTQLTVVGGPEQASGYTWWKVDDGAGTVGWAASQYLKVAP